jgi:Tfp pilus assembly protein PilX
MSDPQPPDLLHRIAILERANRRWKALAFVFAAFLAVLLVVGAAFSVSMSMRVSAARREAERAMQEAQEQSARAEQARKEASLQRQLAQKIVEESTRASKQPAGEKNP